ncbi:MAG: pseudouridine synthase [Xanthomonadales bacterium]|nr:pseudouridine synthase [Xanthomonadales bacterium]
MKPRSGAPATERLQKIMAAAGVASRRAIERHISDGRIAVNGATAVPGTQVSDGDEIRMANQAWRVTRVRPRHRALIYNKPEGEVTTRSDPQGRPTVFDRLPKLRHQRWIAVGRLDINTTGLLLMTTDGELAHAMMHPSSKVDREYACRVRGPVSEEALSALKSGVELDDGPARFSDIVASGGSGENQWFHVTIMEGRNREVRRLWASQGITVSRLKRVRYGAVFLPDRLRMGQWAELTGQDIRILREDVGLNGEPAAALTLKLLKPRRRR